ncbi:hypothetical protein D3C85_723070 [compost metagenome]
MTPTELLKFMLPDFLVDHFEVVSTANTEEILHLYFEEKSKPPQEFSTLELVSKGFQDEITIQDFPLSLRFVYYSQSFLFVSNVVLLNSILIIWI